MTTLYGVYTPQKRLILDGKPDVQIMKYRIDNSDGLNKTLQVFQPSRLKTRRELNLGKRWKNKDLMTKEKWVDEGYYGKWEHIIEAILDRKIIVVSEDLETQLRSIPQQIQDAIQTIIKELEIVEKYGNK